eukprot:s85_g22.t1
MRLCLESYRRVNGQGSTACVPIRISDQSAVTALIECQPTAAAQAILPAQVGEQFTKDLTRLQEEAGGENLNVDEDGFTGGRSACSPGPVTSCQRRHGTVNASIREDLLWLQAASAGTELTARFRNCLDSYAQDLPGFFKQFRRLHDFVLCGLELLMESSGHVAEETGEPHDAREMFLAACETMQSCVTSLRRSGLLPEDRLKQVLSEVESGGSTNFDSSGSGLHAIRDRDAVHNAFQRSLRESVIGRVDRLCPLDVRENLLASFREPRLKLLAELAAPPLVRPARAPWPAGPQCQLLLEVLASVPEHGERRSKPTFPGRFLEILEEETPGEKRVDDTRPPVVGQSEALSSFFCSGAPSPAEQKEAIAAVFKQLIAQGMAPNEAALEAIRRVRSESDAQKQSAAVASEAHMRDSVDESSLEVDCPGGPYTCFICTEAKDASERFLPHRCPEIPETLCCKPCFVAWVESQIDADSPNIKCCHCDAELSNRTLQYLVDAAHWQRYCDSALQRSLKRDANFIWCSKCGGGGWVDPTQPTSKCGWNCPLCDNSFVYCPLCRRDHGSVSCKRFHKLRKEVVLGKQQAQDRDSAGVVQRSSKSCPSCKMPIQKDGGCNYMDCPNCRRHFCWSCGQIMKSSHQKHKCDAGFEASGVVGKTTQGRPCVELTRLFMNVIDIDSIEVMNVDDDDVQDCKDMLVPSADQEAKSPLFVGPSQMDGEILLRLPFNFTSAISWEVTHIHVRATHPPAPNCCRPKSLGLLANSPSATFSDFDDSTAVTVNLEDVGNGVFRASLEPFRTKGTFKRITCLAVKVCAAAAGEHEDELQVFFNGLSVFGVPGDVAASSRRTSHRPISCSGFVLTEDATGSMLLPGLEIIRAVSETIDHLASFAKRAGRHVLNWCPRSTTDFKPSDRSSGSAAEVFCMFLPFCQDLRKCRAPETPFGSLGGKIDPPPLVLSPEGETKMPPKKQDAPPLPEVEDEVALPEEVSDFQEPSFCLVLGHLAGSSFRVQPPAGPPDPESGEPAAAPPLQDFDPSSLVLAQAKQPPADAPAQIVLLEKDDMQAYCTEAYGLQDQPLWAGLKLRLEKERAARSRAKSNAARQKAIAALEVVEEGETEEAKQEPKASEEQVDVLFLIEAPADAEDLQAMSDAGLYEVVDLWTSIFFEGKSVDEADPTVEVPSEVPAGPQLFYEAIHTASTSADVGSSAVCTISDSHALAFEAECDEAQETEVPPTEKTPSERVLAAMLDVVGKEARSRMRYKAWLEAQLRRALCIRGVFVVCWRNRSLHASTVTSSKLHFSSSQDTLTGSDNNMITVALSGKTRVSLRPSQAKAMAFACAVAVVGSGWAGTYTAWRLATQSQPNVCLFEAYHRPGGRTYSTRVHDYILDVGAYRYAGDMHLPADVIENALGLRSACYDPTCRDDDVKAEVKWPYELPLRKIVGFDGRHLGYGAALQAMLAQFESAGGRFFPGAELQGLERSGEQWLLHFNSSGVVPLPSLQLTASSALLALPRPVLMRLPGFQEAVAERWPSLRCTDRDFPATVTEGATTTKVYAIYQDAWWVSKLDLLRGVRENLTTELPVAIHYHDGEVLCLAGSRDVSKLRAWRPAREVPRGVDVQECRGVLQVFYRHSQSCPSSFPHCMDFWAGLRRRSSADPLTLAEGQQGEDLRHLVHTKLLDMHRADFIARNISEEEIEQIAQPIDLAYSVWYHEGTFPAGMLPTWLGICL